MKITCSCGKTLPIPDALAGKRVRCPYCQAKMTVPGGPEDLLVALDSKPTPEELLKSAAEPEAPEHDPLAALGDLAAAVDDDPGAEPAMAQPITADETPPAEDDAPSPADGEDAPSDNDAPPPADDLGDLMAALSAAAPETAPPAVSLSNEPAVAAKPVAVAKKGKAAKANGTKQAETDQADDSEDEPEDKKRNLMPIIMIAIASAGFILLLAIAGLIFLRGDNDSKVPEQDTVRRTPVLPEDDGYRGGNDAGDGGLWPGIPDGRTRKDYEREHGKKALNKR
jgi:hypothetical protein